VVAFSPLAMVVSKSSGRTYSPPPFHLAQSSSNDKRQQQRRTGTTNDSKYYSSHDNQYKTSLTATTATTSDDNNDDDDNNIQPPPPPDPSSNPETTFFQNLRTSLPKRIQYTLRDSGLLRTLADLSSLLLAKTVVDTYPSALADFIRLTTSGVIRNSLLKSLALVSSREDDTMLLLEEDEEGTGTVGDGGVTVEKIVYGTDNPGRQFLSLLTPPIRNKSINKKNTNTNRLVLFIHGGAWGSGFPSLYQLSATPFLNEGYTVAIVGYRTYPTADCGGQVDDLVLALQSVHKRGGNTVGREWRDVTVVGHSSGAHLAALAFCTGKILTTRMHHDDDNDNDDNYDDPPISVDRFVALGGVYDIESHYIFEKGRGVERVSPMSIACGRKSMGMTGGRSGLREVWRDNSPTWVVTRGLLEGNNGGGGSDSGSGGGYYRPLPAKNLIVHGALDDVVPYTSSQKFVAALTSGDDRNDRDGGEQQLWETDLRILPSVDHVDLVLHLMFGGETRDLVLDWMKEDDDVEK